MILSRQCSASLAYRIEEAVTTVEFTGGLTLVTVQMLQHFPHVCSSAAGKSASLLVSCITACSL
jgi:hypothetical protein